MNEVKTIYQYQHIGEKVKAELDKRKWQPMTIVKVGEAINPNSMKSILSRMLKCEPGVGNKPSDETVRCVCQAFGWTAERLWEGVKK